jgi:hypothetical protein
MDTPTTVGRRAPTRAQMMRLARHYQDMARRHRDEERFWLCRALYFGRRSRSP